MPLDVESEPCHRPRPAPEALTSVLAHYPALMEEVDLDFAQMLADKDYDSDAVRDDISTRGGEPMIPTRTQPARCSAWSTKRSMPCATVSSASSTRSRTHAASPRVTTSSSRASPLSPSSLQFGSGSDLSTRPNSLAPAAVSIWSRPRATLIRSGRGRTRPCFCTGA